MVDVFILELVQLRQVQQTRNVATDKLRLYIFPPCPHPLLIVFASTSTGISLLVMLQIFGRSAQEMSWINPFRGRSDSPELSGISAGLAALVVYVGTLQLLRFRRYN